MKHLPLLLLALILAACSDDAASNAEADAETSEDASLNIDVDVAEDIASSADVAVGEDAPSPDGVVDVADPDVEEVAEDTGILDVVDSDAAEDILDSDVADDVAADTAETDSGDDVDVAADIAEPETMTDVEGNVYRTVAIGEQVWMAENLAVGSFNDGTAIPMWVFGDRWFYVPEPEPFYQWANTSDLNNLYDEELPEDYHGAVYNEAVLRSERLAPEGWRMPTPEDFEVLEAFLISDGQAGNVATALKANEGWGEFAGNGDDLYGFRALAAGYVSIGGTATGAGAIALWATTEVDAEARTRTVAVLLDEEEFSFDPNSILLGAPVRLIRE